MKELKTKVLLDDLLKVWETGDASIKVPMAIDAFAHISMLGNFYEEDGMKKAFAQRGERPAVLKIEIIGYEEFIKGKSGQQYATIVGWFVETGTKSLPLHLSFAGTFVNDVLFEENQWKFKKVRFELQEEDRVRKAWMSPEGLIYRDIGHGDMSFISHWKTIDDRTTNFMIPLENMGARVLVPEMDAPWFNYPDKENVGNDEEQLEDIFLRYCYAYDHYTIKLLDDIFAEDMKYDCGLRIYNKREATGYLKLLRMGTPRCFNAGRFTEIKINGNEAECKVERIEPALATKLTAPESVDDMACGEYVFHAVKKDGKWKMNSFKYEV